MITDIYLKRPEDPGYDESSFIEQEEFSMLLAQIKMTLMTPTNSVLGGSQYGVDSEGNLFNFSDSVNLAGLESNIRLQLQTYCTLLKNRNYTVSAYLMPDGLDQFREVIHVMITVDQRARFVIAYD
jgi:hypothetical protein